MKYLYIFLLLLLANCGNNKIKKLNNNKMTNSNLYFNDFNFSTFKGIEPIEKYGIDAFIQILSNDEKKIVLKVFQKEIYPEIYSKYDDDPKAIVHIHKYFNYKKGVIFLVTLRFHEKFPESYCVVKISLDIQQKETISLTGKWNENILNPNLDFDKLKNHTQAYSYYLYKFETQKRGFAINYYIEDYINSTKETSCDLYRGFPYKKINVFWNLYRGYYSSNVDGKFDNCD